MVDTQGQAGPLETRSKVTGGDGPVDQEVAGITTRRETGRNVEVVVAPLTGGRAVGQVGGLKSCRRRSFPDWGLGLYGEG